MSVAPRGWTRNSTRGNGHGSQNPGICWVAYFIPLFLTEGIHLFKKSKWGKSVRKFGWFKEMPHSLYLCHLVLKCHGNIFISLICGNKCIFSLIQSCRCQCAVRAVVQELVKSFRKENPSAATTVFHVQREKSATPQVPQTWNPAIWTHCLLAHNASC